MKTAPPQLEREPEPAMPLEPLARRRMTVLLVALLIFGAAGACFFAFGDFAQLLDERTAAAAAVEQAAGADAPGIAAAERALAASRGAVLRGWARLAGFGAATGIVGSFLALRRRLATPAAVTQGITLMLLLAGVALLASGLVLRKALPGTETVGAGVLDLVVMHALVCMLMPWSARETALPFIPLLLIWALTFLLPNASSWEIIDRVVAVIVSPALFIPGQALAAWRGRRRHEDEERVMLGRRVESLGGELSRARIVHDAMFPRPFEGHVGFEYEYRPILEIGGDYVHAHVCPRTEKVTVTLLDVAGHGLAAALTVNRLFGELERILAENAAAEPGEVMGLLNRYINLTMARHSMFATGTCMMLDPNTGALRWVNAGHPPALLRGAGGELRELPTTTMLLGVLDSGAFDPEPQVILVRPGETVIAYTDGAIEARDVTGRQFGLEGIRATARFDPPPRSWPKFIAGAVAQHHGGQADDDVLIVSLRLNSLRVADPAAGAAAGRRTAAVKPFALPSR